MLLSCPVTFNSYSSDIIWPNVRINTGSYLDPPSGAATALMAYPTPWKVVVDLP